MILTVTKHVFLPMAWLPIGVVTAALLTQIGNIIVIIKLFWNRTVQLAGLQPVTFINPLILSFLLVNLPFFTVWNDLISGEPPGNLSLPQCAGCCHHDRKSALCVAAVPPTSTARCVLCILTSALTKVLFFSWFENIFLFRVRLLGMFVNMHVVLTFAAFLSVAQLFQVVSSK